MLVSDLDEGFVVRGLSPSTFEGYRLNLRRHVLPRLGDRTLSSLRTEDVDRLIADLEADGKAPGTVRNVIVPLRKMLADAVRQGLLLANPAARADLPPAQDFVGKEIPLAHTRAIRQALFELAPVDPLRRQPDLFFVCLFDVALGTGLRLGELHARRWRDVDRDRRLIRVERAYSRQQLRKPKTESGVRSVPLFPSVETAFRELAAQAVERGRYAPDELVFGSMRGTPLQPSNFRQRVWDPALRLAGLDGEGYRFHDLRHTCVSRLVAAGADVKLVQAVAGTRQPPHHSQAVLAPPRCPHHRSGRALRPCSHLPTRARKLGVSRRYFRYRWDEDRGDQFMSWGHATYYFAVNETGEVEKRVEVYDDGHVLTYARDHLADDYGMLSDQPFNVDDSSATEIDEQTFLNETRALQPFNRGDG